MLGTYIKTKDMKYRFDLDSYSSLSILLRNFFLLYTLTDIHHKRIRNVTYTHII